MEKLEPFWVSPHSIIIDSVQILKKKKVQFKQKKMKICDELKPIRGGAHAKQMKECCYAAI